MEKTTNKIPQSELEMEKKFIAARLKRFTSFVLAAMDEGMHKEGNPMEVDHYDFLETTLKVWIDFDLENDEE